jgi:DNA gyrase subunit B
LAKFTADQKQSSPGISTPNFTISEYRRKRDLDHSDSIEIVEIHEAAELSKKMAQLLDLEFSIKNAKCLIEKGNEKIEVTQQSSILTAVRELGKKGMSLTRYKGLGEMNPAQLWETTMNVENRTLLKVELKDAVEADKIFTILMGDQVQPRKDFIERFALHVTNLDI